MSKHYVDAQIENYDDFIHLGKEFVHGIPFEGHFPRMIIRSSRRPKDIFKTGIWWVVSEKFVLTLKSLDQNIKIQTFEATVNLKSGPVNEKYFVLHVLQLHECINKQKSQYTLENGLYFDVNYIELETRLILDDSYLFKIKNMPSSPLFINQAAYDIFIKNKLKGIEYFSLQEWNNSILI